MTGDLTERRQAVLDDIADKALTQEVARKDTHAEAEAAAKAEAGRRRNVAESMSAAVEEQQQAAREFETNIRGAMSALIRMIDSNARLSKLAVSVQVVPQGLLKAVILRRVILWLSPQLGAVSQSPGNFGGMMIYAGRITKVSDCFADSEAAATNTSINKFIERELP